MSVDRVAYRFEKKTLYLPHSAGSVATIDPGDLLYWDSSNNVVKPADSFTWNTSIAVTAPLFAASFIGIAQGAVDVDDPAGNIGVQVSGVFEFPSASATYSPGDLLRAKKQAAANLLEPVTIEAGDVDEAIAIVVDRGASVTSIKAILNQKMFADGPILNYAAHIADPSGGATVDAEARAAIDDILVVLETNNLTASS